MFDVIRIAAFKDNYIWLLRKGTAAVVVDPGDARPVLEVL
jgi:hydroxyacylglutathione hydrolase